MVVFDGHEYLTEEEKRLKEDRDRTKYWKKWGPYVAERQWATGMVQIASDVRLLGYTVANHKSQYERTTVLMVMPGAVSTAWDRLSSF
jgi:hypothetical protein